MGELHFCLLCPPCTALDHASSLSRKLAYVPGPTLGFVKLLASSGSHCTKWADEQHWPAGFESRLVPDLPFIPTLIGLRAFDLVSSRVWWEAATNIRRTALIHLCEKETPNSRQARKSIACPSPTISLSLPLSLSLSLFPSLPLYLFSRLYVSLSSHLILFIYLSLSLFIFLTRFIFLFLDRLSLYLSLSLSLPPSLYIFHSSLAFYLLSSCCSQKNQQNPV